MHPNYITQAFGLTNNIKLHKEASNWLCINLALISSRIMFLDRLNLQSPLVLLCIVFRMKAHIRCIGVSSDRQNMQVMMSDPRYLWKGHSIFIILFFRNTKMVRCRISIQIQIFQTCTSSKLFLGEFYIDVSRNLQYFLLNRKSFLLYLSK